MSISGESGRISLRGRGIVDDYGSAHAPAAEDAFVRETAAANGALQREIREIISQLT